MRHAALALAVASLALLSLPRPAAAEDDEKDELVVLNEKLQAALGALPTGLGLTPTSDEQALALIRKTLKEVKPQLEAHRDDERFPLVEGNVKALEAEEVALAAGHKAFLAIERVRSTHEKGQTAGEESLRAMAAAVTEFQRVTNPRWQPIAAGFGKFVGTLRQEEADLAKQNADLEREKQKALTDARRSELSSQARRAVDRLQLSAKAGEKVAAPVLEELKKAADALQALEPDGGIFFLHEHARFSRLAQFEKPDPEAQQAVAAALGARLVSQGSGKAKAFSVTFPAVPGECYLLLARFARSTGGEKVSGFAWTAKAGRASLQPFQPKEGEQGVGLEQGVCVTQAGPVAATARIDYPGANNALRWAVLGWERAEFPADLALRLALDPVDRCDLAAWKSLWLQPVPGTLVWRGAEPFLLLDEEGRALDLNGAPTTLLVEQLSAKPTGPVQLPAARFMGCGRFGEPVWTPDSKAFRPCSEPVERKLKKAAADAATQDKEWAAEVQKKCGPLYQKLSQAVLAATAEIGAEYARQTPASPIDRVRALQIRLGVRR